MEGLASKVSELINTPYFEQCNRVKIFSYAERKNKDEFIRALEAYQKINIEKTFTQSIDILERYIDIMICCFDVELSN